MRSVADILKRQLNPQGLTLIQSNGEAAWQDVFHLHVHLIPRYHGDGLVRPWGHVPGRPGSIGQIDDSRVLTVDLRGASAYEEGPAR